VIELLQFRLLARVTCVDKAIAVAGPELAAFIAAVSKSLGPGMAKVAVDEWIQEVLSIDSLPGPTIAEWRFITLKVLVRLVGRTSGHEPRAVGA
jgi:hypothetical protein